jgi:MFS family permease
LGIAISSTSVFSFVGFMVVDFGLVASERDAGQYAGWIAGAFWLGAIAGTLVGGFAADRIGRRPVLLTATAVNVATTIAFGFSPDLYWAVALRLIGGFFSPNFIVSKSYINDVCDKSNRSTGFSVISMSFGVGALLGPLLGGLMARPGVKYPHLFSASNVFTRFPYAMQGLVIGVLLVVSFAMTWRWLPESLDKSSSSSSSSSSLAVDDNGDSIEIDLQPLMSNDAMNERQDSDDTTQSNFSTTEIIQLESGNDLHDRIVFFL